jgi:hypothetical protein
MVLRGDKMVKPAVEADWSLHRRVGAQQIFHFPPLHQYKCTASEKVALPYIDVMK